MAMEEGILSMDDKLFDFLTDEQKTVAVPGAEQLTLTHLLTMRTGHREGTSGVVWRNLKTSWIEAYLQAPITGTPGKDFMYSSGTSHMLSMILQKSTGLPIDEYLRPRLFEPMGLSDFTWDKDPDGICSGGNGLTLDVLDFLKWGQLYLNKGRWNGQQLVPEHWVLDSMKRHVDVGSLVWTGEGFGLDGSTKPGEGEGYGYQIWNQPGGSYASGIFGQYCVVIPETNTVIAVFSSMTSKESGPLSYDLIAAGRNKEFTSFEAPLCTTLDLESAQTPVSIAAAQFTGTFESIDGNTSLSFEIVSTSNGPALRASGTDEAGHVDFTAGIGFTQSYMGRLEAPSLHHSYVQDTQVLATATHVGPWSFEVEVSYPVTPFEDHFSFVLATDGALQYKRHVNVNSQGTGLPSTVLHRVSR